jgi:redox-sensitive bicupin YhaK (pirin superfamily)
MVQTMQTIPAHERDLGGGFTVRRLLPSVERRSVGPFVFFDHFGPIVATPADNHDVRPHPHIGLATVTYLFEGAMTHRDSTGVVQRIEPGAINWMTAGRGIVHSERTPDDLRNVTRASHGLQLWAALPEADEEIEPSFSHTPARRIPVVERGGASLRLLVGEALGARSPVPARSPTLYLDIALARGAALALDFLRESPGHEHAIYAIEAGARLNDVPLRAHTMTLLPAAGDLVLRAEAPLRAVLVGGASLGHRHIWWNFVSSRKERIVQAADAWAAGSIGAIPGDDAERMPLPERRP